METNQKRERSLKDFADILLPKVWIVAIVAVVFALAAFVYSSTKKDTFTSSARFLVKYSSDNDTNASLYGNEIAQNKITNYSVVVDGVGFREDVVERAEQYYGIQITAAQFKSMFSFTSSTEAPVFSIHVTHTDPDVAFSLATVVKECVLDKIAIMEGDEGLVEEVDPPSTPTAPNGKNEVRNALIAFLVGVVISAAIILIIAISDVTIRDKKKIEDNFDIPVLGVIPYHDIGKTQGYGAYGGYKNDANL